MARARIDATAGAAAVRAVLTATDAGATADRPATATAVRYLLQVLADREPGATVEVRVPPFGAVQVIEGPRHTRGTPPNVVELDPVTWIAVATGERAWDAEAAAGRISASGTRADISMLLPLLF